MLDEKALVNAIHLKILHKLFTEHSFKDGDNIKQKLSWSDIDRSVPRVIAGHLKYFISSIVQHMTLYKKRYLFFCPELCGNTDPRMPHLTNNVYSMSSVIAYEKTPFTAKEFLKLLKDHEELIPQSHIYDACIRFLEEKSASLDSMEHVKQKKDSLDVEKTINQTDDSLDGEKSIQQTDDSLDGEKSIQQTDDSVDSKTSAKKKKDSLDDKKPVKSKDDIFKKSIKPKDDNLDYKESSKRKHDSLDCIKPIKPNDDSLDYIKPVEPEVDSLDMEHIKPKDDSLVCKKPVRGRGRRGRRGRRRKT